mgnify:CR=1 FL=1
MRQPDHPDTLADLHRLKSISRGSKQAIETSAMNAMWDALDNGASKEEAEKVFFSFFNNKHNGRTTMERA